MDVLGKIMALATQARGWWREVNLRRADKDYKYFRCPNCGQKLRVPRGAGKLRLTCRACGVSFEQNS